jgi:hypothetical protein
MANTTLQNFGVPMGANGRNGILMPKTVHSYNSIAYYAGKAEWETIEVTVRDDVTNAVSTLIGAQMQRQMNFFEQTVPEAAVSYKFFMQLQTLDGGGNQSTDATTLEEWDFEGCFLATVNYQAFDYSSSDAMTIAMTIRFDNATQTGGLMPDQPTFVTPPTGLTANSLG